MSVYLDHNATSPLHPEVADAIKPSYYRGETLLMELDRAGFALSSGSPCHSLVTEPSHVLSAMGVADHLALNAIRASFGMVNSLQDVEAPIAKLQELVTKLPAVIRQVAV